MYKLLIVDQNNFIERARLMCFIDRDIVIFFLFPSDIRYIYT